MTMPSVNGYLRARHEGARLWELVPYAEWTLTLPYAKEPTDIAGVAGDPAAERLYLARRATDHPGCCDMLPIVHFFDVKVEP